MALGIALGEIERSRLRVLRMIGTMAVGGDAFADDLNEFSRVMNLGHQLTEWFRRAFGSTKCRDITDCDFSTADGVSRYIETESVSKCQAMIRQVAVEVDRMIDTAL